MRSVLILSRSGEERAALELVHSMFGYDAEAAAGLLLSLESVVFETKLEIRCPFVV